MNIVEDTVVCHHCGKETGSKEFEDNLKVCLHCRYNSRLTWQDRLRFTADEGSFREFDSALVSLNPIAFPGYEDKLLSFQRECETGAAVVTGYCRIMGYAALIGIMDSHFLMASMGSAVGEKIARLFEYGAQNKLPAVIFAASGGARMQEGIFSLMQMAKTSAALGKHSRGGQLYVSVLTDPTTGGVTASFASLGDIIIAEPGILVGFAGKRIIGETISGAEFPEDFQSAEFLYRHGFVDMIVERKKLRETLAGIFRIHGYKKEGI
jgi:acetyl-CoA carboxylase carboxyl transferase subunit beta